MIYEHKKLSDNLNLLMAKERISLLRLAQATGVPASTIKKIKGAHQVNPTLATVVPIAHYFRISIEQLIAGNPLMSDSSEKHISWLPMLTWEEVIKWPKIPPHYPKRISSEYKNALVLKVETNAMPPFKKGMYLIVQADQLPHDGDYVIVHTKNQSKASIKKILLEDEKIYFSSLSIADHIFPMNNDHRLLGVVLEYRYIMKNHEEFI